ncbi:uncharacterized protein HD556DRAFT_1315116 [Suillus plorans]|uniref:Uncharacterized protein n=1 Tax=Suillus plorans TaxID=116603 RepID=A0A9P7AA56_9AGAM|nr:uncharacterized protein HD556DRAFT_1315116 [Suillus plorans]KAG1784400.1 hypothetical protein HD556DRAFT_1315116 [Suillus plorans]
MVKSKQTCKKSTGGTAPQIALLLPASTGAVTVPGELNVREPSEHNEFCLICRDGSVGEDCLFLCSTCLRVMCSNCMNIPPASACTVQADDVTFVCISCHVGMERHGHASQLPYFGFYRKGQPLLPSFLQIRATLEVSLHSQLSSAPTLMLHLILVDHDVTGGCFELASKFLRPYFPSRGFEFWSIAFDISNASKIDKYRLQATAIVQLLMSSNWARVIVAITNHTDNENGDPFIGYKGNKKLYISARVHSVLDVLLSPWHPLIHGAAESYLWLFSCGTLINNVTSFSGLQQAVIDHRITATIGFNAVRFQPSFATHLLLAFAELVIIECLPIHIVFPDMLGQSYKLGRHTDVFLLMPDNSGSLAVTKFAWTHSELRPWGQYLPVQCPQCGWSNTWCSVNMHKDYIFECKNGQCRKKFLICWKACGEEDSEALLAAQDEQEEPIALPTSLKKAIKEYYAKSLKDKEEADKREAASRQREPSFYKKPLSEWDVAQKLFKQEIDSYDKAQQQSKGLEYSIKYRTGNAREWFNNMTPSQQQEVKFAMKKWNEEGAPEETQAIYSSLTLWLEIS